jgi:hypothetical protein
VELVVEPLRLLTLMLQPMGHEVDILGVSYPSHLCVVAITIDLLMLPFSELTVVHSEVELVWVAEVGLLPQLLDNVPILVIGLCASEEVCLLLKAA